jgi:hypothetical protein
MKLYWGFADMVVPVPKTARERRRVGWQRQKPPKHQAATITLACPSKDRGPNLNWRHAAWVRVECDIRTGQRYRMAI